jgi:hypothetical protein
MFRIELLPAAHGDAIWIEYGHPKNPRRILVDGGPAPSYERGVRQRILDLPSAQRRIDLFIVTHIDCDHIDGAIILLREAKALGVRIDEVWFNGWDQLATLGLALDTYKPIQGEFLSALLGQRLLRSRWNTRVGGGPIEVGDAGPLPAWDLEDEGRLTLLSPGRRQLTRLRARWESALRDFSPGDAAEALRRLDNRREYRPPALPLVFGEHTPGDDRSVANGSSVAFVLEHDGASCLLGGDAQPRLLAASVRRFGQERNPGRGGRVPFDAVKVPHHGSLGNISEELILAIESSSWLISTNGAIYHHPDRETARLVADHSTATPTFFCNYKTESTLAFAARRNGERWLTRYPGDQGTAIGPTGGLHIDLTRPASHRRQARATGRPPRPARPGRRPRGPGKD